MPRGAGSPDRALRSSTWWGTTMTGFSEFYPPQGIETGPDRGVTPFVWGQTAIRLTPIMPAFRSCELIVYGSILVTLSSRSSSNVRSGSGLRNCEAALAPPQYLIQTVTPPSRQKLIPECTTRNQHAAIQLDPCRLLGIKYRAAERSSIPSDIKLGPDRSIPVAHPEARCRTDTRSTVPHSRGNR
jgi:hypothetical protein